MKSEILEEVEVVSYTVHGKPVTRMKKVQNHIVIDTAPQVTCVREIPEIIAQRGSRDIDEEQPTPRQTPMSGGKPSAPAPAPHPLTEHVVNIWNSR